MTKSEREEIKGIICENEETIENSCGDYKLAYLLLVEKLEGMFDKNRVKEERKRIASKIEDINFNFDIE